MGTRAVLADAFDRIGDAVHRATDGLTVDDLTWRPDAGSNSVAWLVWHLTRIEDDHVADLAGTEQVWTAGGWCDRFGLPFPPAATGYGHDADDVGRVRAGAELLLGYHDAVRPTIDAYLERVDADELDRVVDTRWDPPVTAGVRIVSVIADGLQHAGQAAYVRGLLERRG
jgi:hypothetical protein